MTHLSDAERAELLAGIEQWKRTGYGIDPNQIAFRHYPGSSDCQCFECADTPIEGWTSPPPQYRGALP